MEKYKIMATEHSIVQPDMIDVELSLNERFVKCFRVSSKLKNAVPRAECVMHDDANGMPIAYCFGAEMHIVNAPKTHGEAHRQISHIAGITRASLNKFRFYMALRAAMENSGLRPSLSAASNMLALARIQEQGRGK